MSSRPAPSPGALADEGRPKNAAVQEDGRCDGAVDVHLVVEPSVGLNFEQHSGKAIGTEAEANMTLRKSSSASGRPLAAISDVPDDELLGIEVHGADVEPPAAIVRVGDLAQELGVDVPRDQRRERPGVGERISAHERDQDR